MRHASGHVRLGITLIVGVLAAGAATACRQDDTRSDSANTVAAADSPGARTVDTNQPATQAQAADTGQGDDKAGEIAGGGGGRPGCTIGGGTDPGFPGKPWEQNWRPRGYINRLCFDGGGLDRKPRCAKQSGCTDQDWVGLEIIPEGRVHRLKYADLRAGPGRVVAWIDNVDRKGKKFNPWNLPKGHRVYLWMGPDDAGKVIPVIFALRGTRAEVLSRGTGVKLTQDPESDHSVAWAAWDTPRHHRIGLSPQEGAELERLRTAHNGSWINCAEGCCTAQDIFQ